MFGRLMPREGNFFALFDNHADRIAEGSRELAQLMANFSEPLVRQKHLESIDAIEKSADKITHETIALLHKTFITPFDREVIHSLINQMDDILDLIQDVGESMLLYDIQEITPEAQQLADINQMCCDRVKAAVNLLTSMDNALKAMRIESCAQRCRNYFAANPMFGN
jgi:uncharacterized protein